MVVLTSILLPALRRARRQAHAVVCGSNARQLHLANSAYSTANEGRYCYGAMHMRGSNLQRWHGIRQSEEEPFARGTGPLAPFMSMADGIKSCPSFKGFAVEPYSFEMGCGGYGYNNAYLGQVLTNSERERVFESID